MPDTPQHASRWPRIAMVLVAVAALLVIGQGIRTVNDIVAPLFLTINLFVAAWPVRQILTRRGVPSLLATIVLCVVVFAILLVFFFSLGWGVSSLVRELPVYTESFERMYSESVALLASFGITEEQLLTQLQQLNPSSFAGVLQSLVGQLSNFVSVIGVVVVIVFMMVIDADTFPARFAALARHQPTIGVALADFVLGVRRYWIVTSVFGLIVAVIDVGILVVAGVPLALVWGILSFLTNYIPNVGFVLGIIPPVLMALLAQGPTTALVVAILYCVVNFVGQSIIQPKFNGDAVGVTATVSFLSLLVWGYVLGPLGALLGLPATLLFKALLIDHDPDVRWLNAFIAADASQANPEEAGSVQVDARGLPAGASGGEGPQAGATPAPAAGEAAPAKPAPTASSPDGA